MKLLLVAWDGATFDLIKPWAAAGRLPNVSRLMTEGVHGELESVSNMNSAPAWTSFMTGKNPGKHGIFWFWEPLSGSYGNRFVNASDRRSQSVWQLLSDAGHRVGVINFPMTFPAEPVDGFMLAGFDAPSTRAEGFAHPPGLLKELEGELGPYALSADAGMKARAGSPEKAIRSLLEVEERRTSAVDWTIKHRPVDTLAVCFQATDTVQHNFWEHQPDNPSVEDGFPASAIRIVYEKMDELLGRMIASLPEEVAVVLVSDHGAGHRVQGPAYLNSFLQKTGFQESQNESGRVGAARSAAALLTNKAYYTARKFIGRGVRDALATMVPSLRGLGLRTSVGGRYSDINWKATQAYSDNVNDWIRLNVRGREPEGIVEPGADYESARDELIENLMRLKDINTGRPAVSSVLKREEIYWGPYVDRAPDLEIRWNSEERLEGLRYEDGADSFDLVVPSHWATPVSGSHRNKGIMIMKGEPFRRGEQVEQSRIYDVAPTILHFLGLPVPEDLDGKVLEQVFTEEFLKTSVPWTAKPSERSNIAESEYSDEDKELLEERLRGLGYL